MIAPALLQSSMVAHMRRFGLLPPRLPAVVEYGAGKGFLALLLSEAHPDIGHIVLNDSGRSESYHSGTPCYSPRRSIAPLDTQVQDQGRQVHAV